MCDSFSKLNTFKLKKKKKNLENGFLRVDVN